MAVEILDVMIAIITTRIVACCNCKLLRDDDFRSQSIRRVAFFFFFIQLLRYNLKVNEIRTHMSRICMNIVWILSIAGNMIFFRIKNLLVNCRIFVCVFFLLVIRMNFCVTFFSGFSWSKVAFVLSFLSSLLCKVIKDISVS